MGFVTDLDAELVRLCEESGQRPVGDGSAPKELEDRSHGDYPFAIVRNAETPGWHMEGPLNDPQADKEVRYFVVSVGTSKRQTTLLADRIREGIKDFDQIDVPGHRVRTIRYHQMGPTRRDDTLQPPLFTVTDIFEVDTTPTGE